MPTKKTKRKIIGTNKFVIYMYNGTNVRAKTTSKPDHFVYRQWGRIYRLDEDGNKIGSGYPFRNFGDMISFMNEIMNKKLKLDLKKNKTWRK